MSPYWRLTLQIKLKLLRWLATPGKIVEKAGTLYVVVNQMGGSVVITYVKITYRMNTVGCDILRSFPPL